MPSREIRKQSLNDRRILSLGIEIAFLRCWSGELHGHQVFRFVEVDDNDGERGGGEEEYAIGCAEAENGRGRSVLDE